MGWCRVREADKELSEDGLPASVWSVLPRDLATGSNNGAMGILPFR